MPSKYSEAKWSPFHWRSAYKKEWMHVIKDWRRIHTTWYLVILVHIFEALSCNTHSYLRWNKVSGLHPHPFMNKPTNPASHEMHTSYRGYTGLLTGNYWDLTLTFLKMVPSLNAVVSCSADGLLMKYNFDNYFPNISRVLQLRWLSGEKQFIVYSTITSTVLTWQCEVVVVQLPYRFKPEFRRQELAEHFTFSSTQSRVVIQRSSEVSDAASFLDQFTSGCSCLFCCATLFVVDKIIYCQSWKRCVMNNKIGDSVSAVAHSRKEILNGSLTTSSAAGTLLMAGHRQ